jgi:hypothetical protein
MQLLQTLTPIRSCNKENSKNKSHTFHQEHKYFLLRTKLSNTFPQNPNIFKNKMTTATMTIHEILDTIMTSLELISNYKH